MQNTCDVLIVGAGPAGSAAARASAMRGLDTILIDKKESIGANVKCAEGIGSYLLPFLPFPIPPDQLIWTIEGIHFHADKLSVHKRGRFWEGYSVNREQFDKWLVQQAVKNGALLWTFSELTNFEFDEENKVKKVYVTKNNSERCVIPKAIIGADGSESTVLSLLNKYHPTHGDHAEVYSWELENLDLTYPHLESVFAGRFTPSGYAYIFPKSKHRANIGVGGIHPEKSMELYFQEFIEYEPVKRQVKNASYVQEKSKKAVWSDLSDDLMYDNIILAGDAANQNLKPFIEGILPSIICGDIAGSVAFEMVQDSTITSNHYRKRIQKRFQSFIQESNELKAIIEQIYSQRHKRSALQFFGCITELLSPDELQRSFDLSYNELYDLLSRRLNVL